jgi:hypothetical protein
VWRRGEQERRREVEREKGSEGRRGAEKGQGAGRSKRSGPQVSPPPSSSLSGGGEPLPPPPCSRPPELQVPALQRLHQLRDVGVRVRRPFRPRCPVPSREAEGAPDGLFTLLP